MNDEITVIVVDDDAQSIKRLCEDLSRFPEVLVLDTFQSPAKARKAIVRKQPALLFLDVEMPEMSGIELLRAIQPELNNATKVVFYTAYDKYLLEALRSSAFDYLLKPYLPDELTAVIERFRSHISKTDKTDNNIEQSLRKLINNENVFCIQTATGIMLTGIDKILLFQYDKEQNSWTMMHIDNYKLYKLRKGTSAEELLLFNKMFIQISKDCIINLQYLTSIENKTLRCLFCYPHDHIERTASQRFYKRIREALEIF